MAQCDFELRAKQCFSLMYNEVILSYEIFDNFIVTSLNKQPPKRKLMATAKRNIGLEILEGLREIKRGEYGRMTTVPSISSIREKTGISQAKFAQLLGVSVRTLQEWEQGRRAPSGAARTLLLIAQKNPRALLEVA